MPTPIAQSKIFAFSPPSPCAVSVTLARTFSKMRGAPPMKVGLMTPRFSTILVRSPSTAVLKPNSSCTADSTLPEHVGHRQPEVLHVVRTEDVERGDGLALVGPVVVHQPDTLGLAGGPGGVDQGGQVLRDRSRRSGCRPRPAARPAARPRAAASSSGSAPRPAHAGSHRPRCRRTARRPAGPAGRSPAPCWPARGSRRTAPPIRSRPGCRRRPARSVVGYTVVVAPPAHRIARSDRIHSIRVVEAIATRCWGWTPRSTRPAARLNTRSLVCAQSQRLPVRRRRGNGMPRRFGVLSTRSTNRWPNDCARSVNVAVM